MRTARHTLADRVVVISGAGGGVGPPLALGLAAAGAEVALLSRTRQGVFSPEVLEVVDQIGAAGGRCSAYPVDVRDERSVEETVAAVVAAHGRIDVCLNNDAALSLAGTESVPVAAFDLMVQVNVRGALLLTRACVPALRRSPNPHVLTIAPPLNLAPRWLGAHPPYTATRYATTILALGWAAEFAGAGIASNCLWPERAVVTGSVRRMLGDRADRWARPPRAMVDAARAVLTSPAAEMTGHSLLDGEVLRERGDVDGRGGDEIEPELFVDGAP